MKKQGTTDAKRAAANDKPENGKTEKAPKKTSKRDHHLLVARRILK